MVLIALAASLGWVAMIVSAPLVDGQMSGVVYAVGSLICHQLPERSFHLSGHQLPVCARCFGLYAGAALGVTTWAIGRGRRARPWSRGRALRVLAIAAAPTALTVASAVLGLLDPPNAWRAALAVPLGTAGGAVVAAVASGHLE